MLRLGTPYSILTDLVISLSFFYVIRLTYDSHAALCFSFLFTSCLVHSSPSSSLCSAWLSLPFLLFYSATAVQLPHALLRFHSMAVLDARFYLMLLGSRIF